MPMTYVPDPRGTPDLLNPGLVDELLKAMQGEHVAEFKNLIGTDNGYGDPLFYWLVRRDSAAVERFAGLEAVRGDSVLVCFLGLVPQLAEQLSADSALAAHRTEQGWSLLDVAAHEGHAAVVQELLRHDAARQLSRELLWAAQNGFDAVVDLLLPAMEYDAEALRAALSRAVYRNRPLVVEKLLDHGASGAGLLGAAAFGSRVGGKVHILEKLLQNGAEINERNSKGHNALYSQIGFYGDGPNREITDFLVQRGAQVDIFNASGLGLLDHLRALLLEDPALVHARTLDGQTPLHFAAQGNQLEAAQLLVAAGADIQAVDNAENHRKPIDLVREFDGHFVTCDTSPMRSFLAAL